MINSDAFEEIMVEFTQTELKNWKFPVNFYLLEDEVCLFFLVLYL